MGDRTKKKHAIQSEFKHSQTKRTKTQRKYLQKHNNKIFLYPTSSSTLTVQQVQYIFIIILRYLLYFLIIYNCTGKAHTSKCTDLIQYRLVLHLQYSFPQTETKLTFFVQNQGKEQMKMRLDLNSGVFSILRGFFSKEIDSMLVLYKKLRQSHFSSLNKIQVSQTLDGHFYI